MSNAKLIRPHTDTDKKHADSKFTLTSKIPCIKFIKKPEQCDLQ